ncbi:uncharacterized protein LOC144439339 [Glandiceps talaboti]
MEMSDLHNTDTRNTNSEEINVNQRGTSYQNAEQIPSTEYDACNGEREEETSDENSDDSNNNENLNTCESVNSKLGDIQASCRDSGIGTLPRITMEKPICPADFSMFVAKLHVERYIDHVHFCNLTMDTGSLLKRVNYLKSILEKNECKNPDLGDILRKFVDLATREYIAPIRQNLVTILENLDPKFVLPYLIQGKAISTCAREIIDSDCQKCRTDGVIRLLYELPRTEEAYKVFKDALKVTQHDLFKLLDESEIAAGTEMTQQSGQGDSSENVEIDVVIAPHNQTDMVDAVTSIIERVLTERLRNMAIIGPIEEKYSVELKQAKSGCILLDLEVKDESGAVRMISDSKDGKLEELFNKLLITDEIRELVGGRDIRLKVTLDESKFQQMCQRISSEMKTEADENKDEDTQMVPGDKALLPQSEFPTFDDSNEPSELPGPLSCRDSSPTPVQFTGFEHVDALEVTKLTKDSVRARWSTSVYSHTGYRVTCALQGQQGGVTKLLENPSIMMWEFRDLTSGLYRISVSLMLHKRSEDGEIHAIYGPNKWVAVPVEKSEYCSQSPL